MKKITIPLLILSLTAIPFCAKSDEAVPAGSWKYGIYMNGTRIGDAYVKSSVEGDNYISTLEMKITTGDIYNTAFHRVIETKDFKPVKVESVNRIIGKNEKQEIRVTATAIPDGIEVASDSGKANLKINGPYIFDGGYFIAALKREKFKKGFSIKAKLYDPLLEAEETVLVNAAVAGKKKIPVGTNTLELNHVIQYIEDIKTIEMFCDNNGVVHRSLTTMLNNTMELILE